MATASRKRFSALGRSPSISYIEPRFESADATRDWSPCLRNTVSARSMLCLAPSISPCVAKTPPMFIEARADLPKSPDSANMRWALVSASTALLRFPRENEADPPTSFARASNRFAPLISAFLAALSANVCSRWYSPRLLAILASVRSIRGSSRSGEGGLRKAARVTAASVLFPIASCAAARFKP